MAAGLSTEAISQLVYEKPVMASDGTIVSLGNYNHIKGSPFVIENSVQEISLLSTY